jgi:HlyD family secretion protein
VVTYVAGLAVDNRDLSLRPGMTATAGIVATERNDVLLVPNAALRFSPQQQAQAPSDGAGLVARLMPRPPRGGQRRMTTNAAAVREVWVLRDGQPVALAVVPGVSDGRMTEVSSETLQPGMAVIVDQAKAAP